MLRITDLIRYRRKNAGNPIQLESWIGLPVFYKATAQNLYDTLCARERG